MRRKSYFVLILLVVINCAILWFFLHNEKELYPERKQTLEEKLNITIIIPEFLQFDNDIMATVDAISRIYPHLYILVFSHRMPYPYLNLPTTMAKFIYKQSNPSIPWYASNPLRYIKSKYVLLIPDGSRLNKNSVETLLWSLKKQNNFDILVSPFSNERLQCETIHLDLKMWTLKYATTTTSTNEQELAANCEYIANDAIYLFETKIFTNFSEVFGSPFRESFFIQAKVNHFKILTASTKNVRLTRGKLLLTDNHKKWKFQTLLAEQRKALYKRFGIKRLLTATGEEKWYGCNKKSSRCFPSVVDVPYFLYQGRWTPPCCLNALRETARHVFKTLEYYGIQYWLEGGSLLGAARHHDIIPWDYDVDIGMFVNDTIRVAFLQAVWSDKKKHVDRWGYVWERATEGDFMRVQYSTSNHLHVDIFPFYEKGGVMTKSTWFKSHRQDMEFPAHYLNPLERLLFVGVEAMVPNHHRKFLEMKFGEGVVENPQYPFPEKLIGSLKL